MTLRRAAIVAPVRTPVGTFGGSLRAVPVEDLAATAVKAVLERTGIDPELIDDVSFAQSYVNGETPCIGRWAALHAGLPETVPGLQIDRRCGVGLQAVVTAAMMVQTCAADVVLARAGWTVRLDCDIGGSYEEGPDNIIGEASYAMATLLGIDPDPATGGTGSGVTYIAFTGPTSVVNKIEDHAEAVRLGQMLAATLLAGR